MTEPGLPMLSVPKFAAPVWHFTTKVLYISQKKTVPLVFGGTATGPGFATVVVTVDET